MDSYVNGMYTDNEVTSHRCFQCEQGAKIECLLCLKSRVRPVPCFCSIACYHKHWDIHKRTARKFSTNKATQTVLNTKSRYSTSSFLYQTASVQSPSPEELFMGSEDSKYYSPDCHHLDVAHDHWSSRSHVAAMENYNPTIFRQYLITGASSDTIHHS